MNWKVHMACNFNCHVLAAISLMTLSVLQGRLPFQMGFFHTVMQHLTRFPLTWRIVWCQYNSWASSWYMESWENSTPDYYKFAHLVCKVSTVPWDIQNSYFHQYVDL